MMGIDDPVRIINPGHAVKGPYFRFSRHSRMNGSDRGGLALEIFIQFIFLNNFQRLSDSEPRSHTQTNIMAASFCFDDFFDRLKHFGVSLAAHDLKAVLGSKEIDS